MSKKFLFKEKIYSDLLKTLLKELKLGEYQRVKIIVDSRKHKGGILAKNKFREEIERFLRTEHPQTKIEFKIQPSTTDVLLELADFISNIFYRAYVKNDEKLFVDFRFKIVQIKNPLK